MNNLNIARDTVNDFPVNKNDKNLRFRSSLEVRASSTPPAFLRSHEVDESEARAKPQRFVLRQNHMLLYVVSFFKHLIYTSFSIMHNNVDFVLTFSPNGVIFRQDGSRFYVESLSKKLQAEQLDPDQWKIWGSREWKQVFGKFAILRSYPHVRFLFLFLWTFPPLWSNEIRWKRSAVHFVKFPCRFLSFANRNNLWKWKTLWLPVGWKVGHCPTY